MNDPSVAAPAYTAVRTRVRRALVQANNLGSQRAAWARVVDIKVQDNLHFRRDDEPELTTEQIVAELGSMHDNGEATVSGWGADRIARFEGAVLILPDGYASALLTEDRRIVRANLSDVLASGITTDFLPPKG